MKYAVFETVQIALYSERVRYVFIIIGNVSFLMNNKNDIIFGHWGKLL